MTLDVDIARVRLADVLDEVALDEARVGVPIVADSLLLLALNQTWAPKKDLQCTDRGLSLLNGMEVDLFQFVRKLKQLGPDEKLALKQNCLLDVLQIAEALLEIGKSILGARDKLQSAPRRRRGRPSKNAATRVAERLALFYPHLTGRRPAVGRNPLNGTFGPFVTLLGNVLDVLELKAPDTQAEHIARKVCRVDGGNSAQK